MPLHLWYPTLNTEVVQLSMNRSKNIYCAINYVFRKSCDVYSLFEIYMLTIQHFKKTVMGILAFLL